MICKGKNCRRFQNSSYGCDSIHSLLPDRATAGGARWLLCTEISAAGRRVLRPSRHQLKGERKRMSHHRLRCMHIHVYTYTAIE